MSMDRMARQSVNNSRPSFAVVKKNLPTNANARMESTLKDRCFAMVHKHQVQCMGGYSTQTPGVYPWRLDSSPIEVAQTSQSLYWSNGGEHNQNREHRFPMEEAINLMNEENTLNWNNSHPTNASAQVNTRRPICIPGPNFDASSLNNVVRGSQASQGARAGVVMGLAWTALGGSALYIETTRVEQGEGKGSLLLAGHLGDVMEESARIAHTVARSILLEKEPENPFFENSKLHLHVPAGATPEDGPSAGCSMITSMLSLAMKKPVKENLAMKKKRNHQKRKKGKGKKWRLNFALQGVKEKTIAARGSEVKALIFPSANRRDFDELAAHVKEGLEVHFVDDYSQIFELAFGRTLVAQN
ncbi:uncharacterized protein A4U43_C05F1940 [Asparagus officinalis]|uniref:Lon proteolytic domain-containing protein n=1 Tax=Asparagus officinalis TaxID=4686 RepID=A0A5P1ER70_ASPOF|nr:uncharacterized protein A4U43_C05F1940 [Asparagus officinalis]